MAGFYLLERYANDPGEAGASAPSWPSIALERAPAQPTLVMFVHPRCPCSRASIGELNRFCTRYGDDVRVYVAFVVPESVADDWADTDLYRSAARIRGVDAVLDVGGRESRAFGAKTSGQVFLYGVDGALKFAGGITASRGHHGDNAGRTLLEQQVANPSAPVHRSNVFGCALFLEPPLGRESF